MPHPVMERKNMVRPSFWALTSLLVHPVLFLKILLLMNDFIREMLKLILFLLILFKDKMLAPQLPMIMLALLSVHPLSKFVLSLLMLKLVQTMFL
jgi:hypothetical protein